MIKTLFALVCLAGTAYANSCPAFSWDSQWGNGANGRLQFQSPGLIRGWQVTLTFDQDVNGMSAWQGKQSRCPGRGPTCTFKHQPHNRKYLEGDDVQLGFGINFDQTSTPPELVSAIITDKKTGQEYDLCAL